MCLCLIVFGISAGAAVVITITSLPLWKIALCLAGVYGVMFTIAMFILIALVHGVLRDKK